MANEFHYCVSLSIVHPYIDPKHISEVITELRARIETMAGSEKLGKEGRPLVPSRKAPFSHWLAELHEEEKLYSAIRPLSTFILERISDLERHRDFFTQLREDGQVVLLIGWFSESNHSAALFDAETLKKCGDIGLDIELSFYCPLETTVSPGA